MGKMDPTQNMRNVTQIDNVFISVIIQDIIGYIFKLRIQINPTITPKSPVNEDSPGDLWLQTTITTELYL